MPSSTVIIAEDDELLRSLYERKFELNGYAIHTAENGEKVFDLLEQGIQPDLLILDINMPELDGFQVLEKLGENRGFPVVVLSNFADDPHKERAKTLKADRFIEKQHTTIKELLAIAEEIIQAN